eukprot:g61645.t1
MFCACLVGVRRLLQLQVPMPPRKASKAAAKSRSSARKAAAKPHSKKGQKAEPSEEYEALLQYGERVEQLVAASADCLAFPRLEALCDDFGPRASGTQALEDAIDWVVTQMKADKCFDSVTQQPVEIPHWVRGQELCEMTAPRACRLAMLGVGGSVPTPPDGLTAEVLSVETFEELEARKHEVKGKIVNYCCKWQGYPATVSYRVLGADRASKHGAVAVLINSISSDSMNAPHTGVLEYRGDAPPIPAAALSVEASSLLHRLCKRGKAVSVKLLMRGQNLARRASRNVLAELRGTETPQEVVVLGGHIDSWDVGTGAHDDAQGCIAAWEAARLLHQLGLRPRRTLRVVLWVDEENGGCGSAAYKKHLEPAQLAQHVAAIETDLGVSMSSGFEFKGSEGAAKLLKQIGKLLEQPPLCAGRILLSGNTGVDIECLSDVGVPCLLLRGSDFFAHTGYWKYHHCEGDTFDKIDQKELEQNVAVLAAMAFILADMPLTLPRGELAKPVHKAVAWPVLNADPGAAPSDPDAPLFPWDQDKDKGKREQHEEHAAGEPVSKKQKVYSC